MARKRSKVSSRFLINSVSLLKNTSLNAPSRVRYWYKILLLPLFLTFCYGLGLKSFLFYSPLDHKTTESRQRRFISARCGGTTYNPTFRMCCGGTIQVRSGIRPACCGTQASDPNFRICCGGTVQDRSGIKPACWGTQAYDANFRICCGGTIQFRSGKGPACCGTQAHDANFRICCGGIVKFRCWPVSSENSIVMMMIKLKIKIKTIKIIIAPAGISPRGEIPRRHLGNSRVY